MKLKTINVDDASGPCLNWLVAKCVILPDWRDGRPCFWMHPNNPQIICRISYNHEANPKGFYYCNYTTDWADGGPILDRMKGYCQEKDEETGECYCSTPSVAKDGHNHPVRATGPTTLVAGLRCFVKSYLGEVVEVPEEIA